MVCNNCIESTIQEAASKLGIGADPIDNQGTGCSSPPAAPATQEEAEGRISEALGDGHSKHLSDVLSALMDIRLLYGAMFLTFFDDSIADAPAKLSDQIRSAMGTLDQADDAVSEMRYTMGDMLKCAEFLGGLPTMDEVKA